jgi:hypothetical protein
MQVIIFIFFSKINFEILKKKGYCSGWLTESFGIPLISCEISCVAMGHKNCKFVVSTPAKIEECISRSLQSFTEEKETKSLINVAVSQLHKYCL